MKNPRNYSFIAENGDKILKSFSTNDEANVLNELSKYKDALDTLELDYSIDVKSTYNYNEQRDYRITKIVFNYENIRFVRQNR